MTPSFKLLPLALALAVASLASQANPPDWGKATTTPATTLVQPMAPITPSTPATTAPKAGSAFGARPATTTISPAVPSSAMPTTITPTSITPSTLAPATTPATSALAPKPNSSASSKTTGTAAAAKNLFSVDDHAIIIVGGKPVAASELKAKLKADLAAKAGAPKLVKATPRKLDLANLNAMNVMSGPAPKGLGSNGRATVASQGPTLAAIAQPGKPGFTKTSALANSGSADAISKSLCLDKGPPQILEVAGKLKAGSRVTIWGTCFGDSPGRVEVIGQFAGGKLVPAFTAWDKTSITIEVPATIRGAADHNVAVSIVTSDRKTSTAMPAQFVATRERVEVPDRMWTVNGGGFELAATVENATNPAAGGRLAKSVRINPQCALDNMEVATLSGGVSAINGFEVGPPNEANVTVDWVGTCIDTTTWTYNHYIVPMGDDVSIKSACRVALQARTWAYCPAGIAP